jgi:ferritin
MKLSQSLNDAFNQQILHEYRNFLVYKKIQNYFEDMQLKNLASYFSKQADDEKSHADKFLNHINDRIGGIANIGDVQSLPYEIRVIEDVGKIYLVVEEETTKSIESLFDLAFEGKSFVDLPFIEEMLAEQIKEEDEALELSTKLNMCKDIVLFDAMFK